MLNLTGVLDAQSIQHIHEMTTTRFVDYTKFKTPESLICYEQGYLTPIELLDLCDSMYEEDLQEPTPNNIPQRVADMFLSDERSTPIRFIQSTKVIEALYVPELGKGEAVGTGIYHVKYIPTTLHYFILQRVRIYGNISWLLNVPGKQALDMILEEAIRNNVPDLTISNVENIVQVYYNKGKRKVLSNNIFPKYIIDDIIKVLTVTTPIADKQDKTAKYVGYDVDDDYRARVVINHTYWGYAITIRLFPKAAFNATYEDLNLGDVLSHFLRSTEFTTGNGIRLIVGETMSGKNTTSLAILKCLVDSGLSKVVSIEMPMEQTLPGVEQIDVEFIDEYVSNIESLIHQNPDFVYITETKDETGKAVMKIANTGKRILTTLHSNSVHDTISRITDITGMSSNRVIQVLHSIIHQRLVSDDGVHLRPVCTYCYFDEDFKQQLYDKSFGEIISLIKQKEVSC